MKKTKLVFMIAIALLVVGASAQPAGAQDLDLVKSLVSGLGVSEAQAKGGTKALIEAAKSGLSGDEFSQLTALPQLAGLMGNAGEATASAGEAASLGSMADSAMGAMGGDESEGGSDSLSAMAGAAAGQLEGMDLGSLSNLQGLTSAFGALGLDAGMVQKFVPIVLEGLGGSGGKELLMKGLGLL